MKLYHLLLSLSFQMLLSIFRGEEETKSFFKARAKANQQLFQAKLPHSREKCALLTIRHLIFPSQRLLPGERQSRFQSRAELSELSISIAEEADFSPFSARSSGAISNMQMSRRKSDAAADLIRPLSNPFYEQSGRSPLIRWKTEKREASTTMILLRSLTLSTLLNIHPSYA